MRNIKGKTVRVTLGKRANQEAVEKYGDIWEVIVVGERFSTLTCGSAIWTPPTNEIKEVELEDGRVLRNRDIKVQHKYKTYLFM